QQCLDALSQTRISTVDVTGGAPELNPNFRWLVEQCRTLDRHVIDRCNLTVLDLPSQADLADFLAANQVEVVCSLPHYRELNTDRQRGDGVFEKSIKGLQRLNELGYGDAGSGLRLVLVTNPVGAFLPAKQKSLEQEWQQELGRKYGIRFDALYTITNMPISRFLDWLIESTNLNQYMERLVTSFNPSTVEGLMCRNMLSIGWDGSIYDCDFNQMLELPVTSSARHIRDFDVHALQSREIVVDRHCFGCTAGAGSSCSGATTT
ncbi:MAG: arsenosugar biosynthesis radical SAM (seleno)protein ArsS, partial [Acidobacteriota bacterium]|nr:arsenosugar biosynthesis radical SAM (seleno)protein ArsS [Acidobacteriota bacterium]